MRIYYQHNGSGTKYYISTTMNSSGKFEYNTNANNAMIFKAWTLVTTSETIKVDGWGYEIKNTPLPKENETSLNVQKFGDLGLHGKVSDYEQLQVTVQLLANGVDTGRTVTLNLKNNWTATFQGLPYRDADGNVIVYTVEEATKFDIWRPTYGPVTTLSGNPPTYGTHITNVHASAGGPMLPGTGSAARMIFVLCGAGILLATLVYALISKHNRGMRED